MPRSSLTRIAIAVAATLVLAACGDDRATTPEPPIEEAEGETAPEDATEQDPPAFEEAEPEVEEPAQEAGSADREEVPEDAALDPEEESPVSDDEQRASGESRGGSVDPGLEEEVELAIQDTVEHTGAERSDVEVQLAERVTWNDGSLGCPRSGEMYTQALVEGYRILVSAEGQERAYHGRDGDEPFYCSDPRPATGGTSGGGVDR